MRILAFLSTISLLWRKLTVEQVTSLQLGQEPLLLNTKIPACGRWVAETKKAANLKISSAKRTSWSVGPENNRKQIAWWYWRKDGQREFLQKEDDVLWASGWSSLTNCNRGEQDPSSWRGGKMLLVKCVLDPQGYTEKFIKLINQKSNLTVTYDISPAQNVSWFEFSAFGLLLFCFCILSAILCNHKWYCAHHKTVLPVMLLHNL